MDTIKCRKTLKRDGQMFDIIQYNIAWCKYLITDNVSITFVCGLDILISG